ncbi:MULTISPECIES: hypothetical protein [unclassified Nocardioides]|uniref:hypothetical protein n=1 Tax=unclassified Nocardioides TaxID=2615069 RepID=UPI0002EF921B|nr:MULTISPECIES: hypothetical protein [unclassified Nocardioides]MBI2243718.1 hypothetical protein [Nocardioides sp.]
MNELLSADLATRLTAAHVTSARPQAPVVAERASRPAPARAVRAGLAAELRAIARWVEPRPTEACQPS